MVCPPPAPKIILHFLSCSLPLSSSSSISCLCSYSLPCPSWAKKSWCREHGLGYPDQIQDLTIIVKKKKSVRVWVCVREQFMELALCFHHVGTGEQNWVRFSNKPCHSLSHFQGQSCKNGLTIHVTQCHLNSSELILAVCLTKMNSQKDGRENCGCNVKQRKKKKKINPYTEHNL